MRTEIFTEAWRLYRMYDITFAKALSIAWAKYKSDAMAEIETESKEFVIVWKNRMSLLSGLVLRAVFVPNIESYYGTGHYNAD